MAHQPWTRDQLLAALALYCQLPFGKMHSRNPEVETLATAIGRTPAAIALKLVNFASLDPELQDRGVGGMGNTSAADRAIWSEFYGRWEAIAKATVTSSAESAKEDVGEHESPHNSNTNDPTEINREVAQRRGQGFFRSAVLAAYDYRCCVTGISELPLLRASHIVPWAQDHALRLNPRNGLCLNALHDAAFDRGLITFSVENQLRVSRRLKASVPERLYSELFANAEDRPVAVPERFKPLAEALEFHRTHVFLG